MKKIVLFVLVIVAVTAVTAFSLAGRNAKKTAPQGQWRAATIVGHSEFTDAGGETQMRSTFVKYLYADGAWVKTETMTGGQVKESYAEAAGPEAVCWQKGASEDAAHLIAAPGVHQSPEHVSVRRAEGAEEKEFLGFTAFRQSLPGNDIWTAPELGEIMLRVQTWDDGAWAVTSVDSVIPGEPPAIHRQAAARWQHDFTTAEDLLNRQQAKGYNVSARRDLMNRTKAREAK